MAGASAFARMMADPATNTWKRMLLFKQGDGLIILSLVHQGNPALYMLGLSFETSLWLLTVPVATGWTRMVLSNTEQKVRLAVGRAEAVYLLRYVCIALLAFGTFAIVIALFVAMTEITGFNPGIFDTEASSASTAIMIAVVLIPAAAAAVLIVSRFVVAFPAAAVGDPSRLRDSFALTKGRTWGLFTILILTLIPDGLYLLAFTTWEFDMELGPTDGIFSAAWIAIQNYAVAWVFFPLSVGALALVYGRLGGMPDKLTALPEPPA